MGRRSLGEVRDRSLDSWIGPGRIRGPLERFGTGQRILGEVQDWWRTLGEVWDGSRDPRGGP